LKLVQILLLALCNRRLNVHSCFLQQPNEKFKKVVTNSQHFKSNTALYMKTFDKNRLSCEPQIFNVVDATTTDTQWMLRLTSARRRCSLHLFTKPAHETHSPLLYILSPCSLHFAICVPQRMRVGLTLGGQLNAFCIAFIQQYGSISNWSCRRLWSLL
jgi:hypothetical protein